MTRFFSARHFMAALLHSAAAPPPPPPHPAFVATRERTEEAHAPGKDGDSEALLPRSPPRMDLQRPVGLGRWRREHRCISTQGWQRGDGSADVLTARWRREHSSMDLGALAPDSLPAAGQLLIFHLRYSAETKQSQ